MVDIGTTILNDAILWVLIVIGDGFVFTFIYRRMFRRWWWTKPQKYSFWINENGWGIEGTGDPVNTLLSMFDDFMNPKDEKHGSKK
jgi:hypothetical protein